MLACAHQLIMVPGRNDPQSLNRPPESYPVPENYGQMIVDGVSHFAGVQKYVHRIGPRYSQMLGNWLQGRMTKK